MVYGMSHSLDGFRSWLVSRGRERSSEQYAKVVKRWLANPAEIREAMVSRGYSPNYRRHLTACIRSWAQYTGDSGLQKQLGDLRQPPAVPASVREPFAFERWEKIRKAIDRDQSLSDPLRATCGMIAVRGIRCGDVLRLTEKNITEAIESGTLAFESKGERWQNYSAAPMLPYLEQLAGLRWWSAERVCELICPRSAPDKAQASAGRSVRHAFDRIARKLRMKPSDLYAHRFRHTYATYFLQMMEGDPEAIFKLQQQMGWARLDTAANYLRRGRRAELDAVESRLLAGRGTQQGND